MRADSLAAKSGDNGLVAVRARLETRVLAAMTAAANTQMVWGKDDCMLWIANILMTALGYDPAYSWRNTYGTRAEAISKLGVRGILPVIRECARRHRWKRIDASEAQPGDVGVVKVAIVEGIEIKWVFASVICRSAGWFVGRNEFGATMLPASRVRRSWAVV